MLFDVEIRDVISRKKIQDSVSEILGISANLVIIGYENFEPDINLELAVFLRFIERPSGFKLSLELGSKMLVEIQVIVDFLKKLSCAVNSDIFIDRSENYGLLISPIGDIKVVRYGVFNFDGEEYVDLI